MQHINQEAQQKENQHLSLSCQFLGWPTSEGPKMGPKTQWTLLGYNSSALGDVRCEGDKASVSGLLLPVWQIAWGRVSLRFCKNRIKVGEPRRSGQYLEDGECQELKSGLYSCVPATAWPQHADTLRSKVGLQVMHCSAIQPQATRGFWLCLRGNGGRRGSGRVTWFSSRQIGNSNWDEVDVFGGGAHRYWTSNIDTATVEAQVVCPSTEPVSGENWANTGSLPEEPPPGNAFRYFGTSADWLHELLPRISSLQSPRKATEPETTL